MAARALGLAAALLAVACGGGTGSDSSNLDSEPICDRAERSIPLYLSKVGNCPKADQIPPFDRATCDAAALACGTDDTQKMHRAFDCLDNLGVCDPAGELLYEAMAMSCLAHTTGVSLGCQAMIRR